MQHRHKHRRGVVCSAHYIKMDAKFVILLTITLASVSSQGNVVFNFREKLWFATSTTTEKVQTGQVIRVPELECPLGQRRDALGNCRQRF
ncbi:insect cytokine precursor uENF2 [Bombyx mori]|uniref:Insect cytokine uENF2 n=1 Tax=Bombyx mori TaxID=7091 RepID=E1CEF8_BOMMO|nr:insect cytokine precursor uENF2 [Bombyx mori]BAJ21199.1 insect cytokine precursor uENF2 [Bombyx mori]BAJ21214.1 insect cytokine precursor uENF2 [Bombyx mori]